MIEPVRIIQKYPPRTLAEEMEDFRTIPWGRRGLVLYLLVLILAAGTTLNLYNLYAKVQQPTISEYVAFGFILLFLTVTGFSLFFRISPDVYARNFGGYSLLLFQKAAGEGPSKVVPVLLPSPAVYAYLNAHMQEWSRACISLSLDTNGRRGDVWVKRPLEPGAPGRLSVAHLDAWHILDFDVRSGKDPWITLGDGRDSRRLSAREILTFLENAECGQHFSFQAATDAAINAARQPAESSAA